VLRSFPSQVFGGPKCAALGAILSVLGVALLVF